MRRVLIAVTIAILGVSVKGATAQYGDLLVSDPDFCSCGFTWTQFAILRDGHLIDMGIPRAPTPLLREMVVDRDGFIYATDESLFTITKYTPSMQPLLTFNGFALGLAIDASGAIYGMGGGDVTKFDRSGNVLAKIAAPGGAMTGDLERDQCTLVYLDRANVLRRFNVCTNSVVGDPQENLSVFYFPMLRVSANGDIFFSSTDGVRRLSPNGQIRVYGPPSYNGAFALQGNMMWTTDAEDRLEQIDLTTGNVIAGPFGSGGAVFGLEVYGTPRAAVEAAPLPALSPWFLAALAAALIVVALRR